MARVFRQTFHKTTRDGRRVRRETKKWYVGYTDHNGRRHKVPGYRDKRATEALAADLQKRVDRQKAGIIDAESVNLTAQLTAPIATHVEAYETHLRACGVSAQHLSETIRRLNRIVNDCEFVQLSKLKAEPVQRWVGLRTKPRDSGEDDRRSGGARTINTYLGSLKAFIRWAISDGRLATDPLITVRKLDEAADVRRVRRALAEDEIRRLLEVASTRPLADAMTVRRGKRAGQQVVRLRDETKARLKLRGRERRLIYMALVLTGLRKGELTQLEWRDLDLDEPNAWLTVRAGVVKNGKRETLPIRADLAAELRSWRASNGGAAATGRVFRVPRSFVLIFDRDLIAAGIARRYKDEHGRWRIDKRDAQGRTLDVHALRHTTATHLAKAGVAPRTAQAIMRHSDIRLTLGTYTDPKLLDTAAAVESLPSLAKPRNQEPMKATGTDDATVDRLGLQLGPKTRSRTRLDARTRTEPISQRDRRKESQLPVDAEPSTNLHDLSQKRATRLERATFSLEG